MAAKLPFEDAGASDNEADAPLTANPMSLDQLLAQHPSLSPPIIHNLLREGETANLIAASKTGKSWLAMSLAAAVASGRVWLGRFPVERGAVLLIDNELHPQTIAHRLPLVYHELGICGHELAPRLSVESLRGRLKDIFALHSYFGSILPGLYRLIPRGSDENSNADICAIFNAIDRYAARLKCAFVCVHHASKGIQSGKAVTDVGSGAGAQARAVDSHLVIRPHSEEGAVVVEAAVRSFAPLEPFCLRWQFPRFVAADDLDPADLKKENQRTKKDEHGEEWTAARFAASFVTATPTAKNAILTKAQKKVGAYRTAEGLLGLAESEGLIHRWKMPTDNRGVYFSTMPQVVEEGVE